MKILVEKPPVWDNLCGTLGIVPNGAVFTYGETIYNPSGANLDQLPHIVAHERVHRFQQELLHPNHKPSCPSEKELDEPCSCGAILEGAALWWGRWMREPKFRFEQEIEGYREQYMAFCELNRDRNARAKQAHAIALTLSGPLYGKCGEYGDIIKRIKA